MGNRYLNAVALSCFGVLIGCGDGGEDGTCNSAAWHDEVTFELHPALSEPGEYQLQASADESHKLCEVVVADVITTDCDEELGYGDLWVRVQAFGEPPSITAFDLSWPLSRAPASTVSLALERDGQRLFEIEAEPEYVRDEPNGKDCGLRSRAKVAVNR